MKDGINRVNVLIKSSDDMKIEKKLAIEVRINFLKESQPFSLLLKVDCLQLQT